MKKILIIDDDKKIRDILKRKLSDHQTQVMEAENGLSGLRSAAAHRPDIILLDVRMPDMNGYQVCKAMRDDYRTRSIPVIMLTGLCDLGDHLQGLRCGADEYLTKPIDFNWLAAKIHALISLGGSRKQFAFAMPA